MRAVRVTCDGCGAIKGDTNHWLAMQADDDPEESYISLGIASFNNASQDAKHYCGEQCLLKAVAAALPDLHKYPNQDESST